jgi:Tfp pilus assembly protein PilE
VLGVDMMVKNEKGFTLVEVMGMMIIKALLL